MLRILFTCLLLTLVVALGAEVVALHQKAPAAVSQVAPPVVVRKSPNASTPPKTVRPLTGHPPPRPAPHRPALSTNKKSPAS